MPFKPSQFMLDFSFLGSSCPVITAKEEEIPLKVNGKVNLAVEMFLGSGKVGTMPLDGLHVYVEKLLREGALQF
jgi:hypothetical protein